MSTTTAAFVNAAICVNTTANSRLLPYETIIQATTGEPEAVNAVLQHYGRYIRFSALVDGQVDKDAEDYITQTLLAAIFKFRFTGRRLCNYGDKRKPDKRNYRSAKSWTGRIYGARHKSTVASVCPLRTRTPPFFAMRGNI